MSKLETLRQVASVTWSEQAKIEGSAGDPEVQFISNNGILIAKRRDGQMAHVDPKTGIAGFNDGSFTLAPKDLAGHTPQGPGGATIEVGEKVVHLVPDSPSLHNK